MSGKDPINGRPYSGFCHTCGRPGREEKYTSCQGCIDQAVATLQQRKEDELKCETKKTNSEILVEHYTAHSSPVKVALRTKEANGKMMDVAIDASHMSIQDALMLFTQFVKE